jgi:endonuclease YncB( thermonuclease family)
MMRNPISALMFSILNYNIILIYKSWITNTIFVCKKCKKVDTIKVQLNNIDTPEIKRSSNLENRATVKVKEYVANLILNKYANVSNSRSMVEF